MTQLEIAKETLFGTENLHVKNVKLFPGTNRDATPEQVGAEINLIIARLSDGDYDDITDECDA
jgi:hypothetical protein